MIHLNPLCRAALCTMLLTVSQLYAASLPPSARSEIEGLLLGLTASDCQFERNGSWHKGAEAQAHLRRKLDYLVARGAVASTEQFIARAATQSSISGKPYHVQCAHQATVPSGQWLQTRLHALRARAKH